MGREDKQSCDTTQPCPWPQWLHYSRHVSEDEEKNNPCQDRTVVIATTDPPPTDTTADISYPKGVKLAVIVASLAVSVFLCALVRDSDQTQCMLGIAPAPSGPSL